MFSQPDVRIAVHGLAKSFGGAGGRSGILSESRHTVLERVSFEVQSGEIVLLRGANGSGKTTLLKIIAGLVIPDSGEIRLDPVNQRAARIGFSSGEERSLFWRLTGRQNLELFAALLGIPAGQHDAMIRCSLESVGLDAVANTPVRTLSSGQRQRLLIARALLGDPDVLLLDEPGARLDQDGTALLWSALAQVAHRGAAVVVATHDQDDEQRAHRVARLDTGELRMYPGGAMSPSGPAPRSSISTPRLSAPIAVSRRLRALFVRDWRQARSYPFAIVFQLVATILGGVGLFYLSRFVGSGSMDLRAYGGSYFAFAVLGTAALGLQLSPVVSCARTVREGQLAGTLEAMLATPTSMPVLLVGSSLWTLAIASLDAIILVAASVALGMRLHIAGVPLALAAGFVLVVASMGIGLAEAGIALVLKRGSILSTVFAYGSSLCGGVLYPIRVLPMALQGVAIVLPVMHVANALRYAVVAGDPAAASVQLALAASLALAYWAVGMPVLLYALHRSKRTGALGQY